jgi:thymidylate kinase
MSIILEGMDNSGKSTLARMFGLEVIHPGPAPKSYDEELKGLNEQSLRAGHSIVYDRVTCISSQVYKNKVFDPRYMQFLRSMYNVPGCVIVYCRPPDDTVLDFSKHEAKSYDTPESLQLLSENATQYLRSYDKLMYNVPHLLYNYTISNDTVEKAKLLSTNLSEWYKWNKWPDLK